MVKIYKNRTILDQQLENLKKINTLETITIVVGFKKNLIQEKYPFLSSVYNKNYKKTNTSKSLLLALNKLKNSDVLWLNGDVVFESSILNLIQNTNDNCVFVNNNEVNEEEVKYTVDNDGYIKNISKSVKNGLGEAVGINFIKKEYINLFVRCLRNCEDSDYFEKGIELSIQKGVKFIPLDIKDKFCIEVDFEEDLESARSFYRKNGD